ncbi:hypothetical protein MIMGU_mgv11b0174042mg, partial [Erythranthe guttata]
TVQSSFRNKSEGLTGSFFPGSSST